MMVKNIAIDVAEMLQDCALRSAVEAGAEHDGAATLFLSALMQAAQELSCDFPILRSKSAYAKNGIISPSDIDGCGITSVVRVAKNGKNVRFAFDALGVAVSPDGEYTVYYTVECGSVDMAGDIALGVGTDRFMLEYLTTKNYCMSLGRVDEAEMWGDRYRAAAENRRLKRRAHIPARDFFLRNGG